MWLTPFPMYSWFFIWLAILSRLALKSMGVTSAGILAITLRASKPMQLTESPPAVCRELTIRSRLYGGRLTVFRMMIISSSEYLMPAGRTTSVTSYPIRFVIEALLIEFNYIFHSFYD